VIKIVFPVVMLLVTVFASIAGIYSVDANSHFDRFWLIINGMCIVFWIYELAEGVGS
jgi:uncharacterized membrane protein (DUF485 family)